MSSLNLVQLSVSLPRITSFYGRIWPRNAPGCSDEKFILKTALTEVLVGDAKLRPWRIQHASPDGTLMVLGYSHRDAAKVKTLIADGLPELANAFDAESVFSRPIRQFAEGERLQVQARVCATKQVRTGPTQRKELDAWAADTRLREKAGQPARGREEAYEAYLADAILPGAAILNSRIVGFAINAFARKDANGIPSLSTKHPVVEFDAICEVTDSQEFARLLATGIGRSRAYGCGMLLIRAAA